MDQNIISITQFSNYIKSIFEAEYLLQNICIYGEVSSYNISNGIAYFTIKDESSMLNCVMFSPKEKPQIGDMIIVKGSPNYYSKGGRFSFNVSQIMPYGKGVLYENFLKLKDDLEKKGYFDVSKKKPIPERVKRIGVVTSRTGAVLQDIIDITRRRNNSVDIVLFPVKVQGIGAELEIANGINFFSCYNKVDVVIVARGGGSIEDLQPFNTEVVATAVYNCNKPLVSAVGHETDYTIIDFCSDLRAPTPSAAAELVVRDKRNDIELIDNLIYNIEVALTNKLNLVENKLNNIMLSINRDIMSVYRANEYNCSLGVNRLCANMEKFITNKETMIKLLSKQIENLNPKYILDRGYIKAFKDGKKITSVANLSVGDNICIEMSDGKAVAKVDNIERI